MDFDKYGNDENDAYDWLEFDETKIIGKYHKYLKYHKEIEKETEKKEFEKYRRNIFEYCKYGEYTHLQNLLNILKIEFDKETVSKIINTRFNGTRAVFICIENRNLSCLELLIKHGANLKLKNNRNNILHISCLKNYPEFIHYILDIFCIRKYINIINEKNFNELTPLQIYMTKTEYDMIHSDNIYRKFIMYGANINISEQLKNKNTNKFDKIIRNTIKDTFKKNFNNNEVCVDMFDTIIDYIR